MSTQSMCFQSPDVLTVDEIDEAFQKAFPGHELHDESVAFARAVEQMVQAKLYPCASAGIGDINAELLRSLRWALDAMAARNPVWTEGDNYIAARAAIAKATGSAS